MNIKWVFTIAGLCLLLSKTDPLIIWKIECFSTEKFLVLSLVEKKVFQYFHYLNLCSVFGSRVDSCTADSRKMQNFDTKWSQYVSKLSFIPCHWPTLKTSYKGRYVYLSFLRNCSHLQYLWLQSDQWCFSAAWSFLLSGLIKLVLKIL